METQESIEVTTYGQALIRLLSEIPDSEPDPAFDPEGEAEPVKPL